VCRACCASVLPPARRYLPQAGLRVPAFGKEDKEYQVLLDGPLVGRWKVTKWGRKQLIDEGLIEKFASAIKPFVTREASGNDEQMHKEKSRLYPWETIRQAAINALAHRDWIRSVDVEVTQYSDRLEVISPAKLQSAMTVGKMIAGQHSPRNTLIMEILRDHGYRLSCL
jgi:ATP-dependent DNA helicase RecG